MNSKRYRILYVEKATLVGGTVMSLYELVRNLDTSLYEPVILFHGPNPYREKFQQLGVKVHTLSENEPLEPAVSLQQRKWIAKAHRGVQKVQFINRVTYLLREEAIDLVHHNNNLPKNRSTVIAARLAGVPQICHIRMLHKPSFLERYLARSVDRFIYISKAVEQLYCDLGIPATQGQTVYNGFDVSAFEQINCNQIAELRAEFGITDQDWLVTNVGRLDNWKGQDYFLQAIAEAIPSQPNIKALIVGAPEPTPWNQRYYQKLQQLVKDLQLLDRVIFTGYRTDIPRIMVTSDILVHSSSQPEPFGRVVVEGMLAGRPVIATAAGGVLDIIEDQITGLLVPPKDATQMAKAILQITQNREKAKSMGQLAQKQAKERFSSKQYVTSVQQIYQKVLAKT